MFAENSNARFLRDTHPVDEHLRRIGTALGITTARPGNGQVQHRKHPVVGEVERPIVDGERRNLEVRLRTVDVVEPEVPADVVRGDTPVVPRAVNGERLSRAMC